MANDSLLAGLKLPGRGWLEFTVTPLDGGRRSRICQTARFDPKGVLGRVYWYAVMPFHAIIFRGLLRRIAQLAAHGDDAGKRGLFVHRSVVAAPAAAVFNWHERPEALEQLMPPGRLVRIEHRAGGLRDGGRVTLSIGSDRPLPLGGPPLWVRARDAVLRRAGAGPLPDVAAHASGAGHRAERVPL